MGVEKGYFFDTYAFFELFNNNPKYKECVKNHGIITTKMNLMELYFGFLSRKGKEYAEKAYAKLSPFCIEISDTDINCACIFKFINKTRNISYVDAIGYSISLRLNIPFLTGDKEFADIENVEYVK
jgi:hypothetical protein